jgi:hypothetical protein
MKGVGWTADVLLLVKFIIDNATTYGIYTVSDVQISLNVKVGCAFIYHCVLKV